MKKLLYSVLFIGIVATGFAGCSKSSPAKNNNNNSNSVQDTLEGQVLTDFSYKLVDPNFQDMQKNVKILNDAINQFIIASSTDHNLLIAKSSWINARASWELYEGFLFGPTGYDSFHTDMDSWPANTMKIDSLLNSPNLLSVNDIDALPPALKGFHAIEYILFGVGGTRKAVDITPRQKTYLLSLAQSLNNTTTSFNNDWNTNKVTYISRFISTGKSTSIFKSRQALFLALVDSMANICDEVANTKMQIPFAAKDSTLSESSFSHNSVTDFTNNITVIKNAYLSRYTGASGNYSLSGLVASKNATLNSTLLSQMDAAISSFNAFATLNVTFEQAIYTQPNAITGAQAAINTLKASLNGGLHDFVTANIKD